MTLVATLNQTSLPPGAGNTRTNANIPDTARVARLSITKIAWPGTGEECGWFRISYSTDNAKTWKPLMSSPVNDDPNDPNPLVFTASIDEVNINRKLLIEWIISKALTLAGILEAV
jgi:hypothetical protein